MAFERNSHGVSGLFRGFCRWVADKIIQDVPEDTALCEFDCQKGQCTDGEWANCDRRIKRAAGELWPDSGAPTSEQAQAVEANQDRTRPIGSPKFDRKS
jgi:hypothetical protein